MPVIAAVVLGIVLSLGVAEAHLADCWTGFDSAAPGTYNEIHDCVFLVCVHYYIEERDPAAFAGDSLLGGPIPGSGFATGNGTWWYEEANDLPGLQRGGVGLLGDWFPPGCDQSPFEEGDVVWQESGRPATDINSYHVDPSGSIGVPCAIIGEDPINNNTCGHGPDTLILGLMRAI